MEISKHRHNIGIAVTLVLMLSFFIMNTSPQITGFATYTDSNSYIDTLDLDVVESQIVSWTPENIEYIAINSLKLSGAYSNEADIQIYVVGEETEFMIFSTVVEDEPAGFQITGHAVADTSFSIPVETGEDTTEQSSAEPEGISEADNSEELVSDSETVSEETTSNEVETQEEAEQLEDSSEAVDSIVQDDLAEQSPAEPPAQAEGTDSEPLIEDVEGEDTADVIEEDETEEEQQGATTEPEQNESVTDTEQEPTVEETEKIQDDDVTEPAQEQVETITFEDQCVETCDISLQAKEFELKIVVSSGEIHIDSITYTILPAETEEQEEVNEMEINETEINSTIVEELQESRTEETIQLEQVVINQPARWKKIVTLAEPTTNVEITVPAEAQNLRLIGKDGFTIKSARILEDSTEVEVEPAFGLVSNDSKSNDTIESAESTEAPTQEKISEEQQEDVKDIRILIEEEIDKVEIEYETEGPTAQETELVSGKKQVTVASEIHYEDVLAFTDIPNTPSEAISFYWHEETQVLNEETGEMELVVEKRDVTYDEAIDLTYYDSDDDGLVDYVEWIVPHLSNQTFDIQITVLNVQSYPMVGGNWTVMFETVGTANLTISTVDGTTWSDTSENSLAYDLKLLEVLCGNQTQNYTWTSESKAFIEDYSCDETGYETSKVLTEGGHYLLFEFGNVTARAQNAASDCHVTATETMSADVTCPAGFNVTSTGSLDTNGHNITVTGENISIEAGGELNLTESSNISSTVDVEVYGILNASGTDSNLSFGALTIASGGTYEATNATTTLTSETASEYAIKHDGTFTHNDGTVKVTTNVGSATLLDLSGTSGNLYNLDIDMSEITDQALMSANTIIDNDLTINAGVFGSFSTKKELTVIGDVVVTKTLGLSEIEAWSFGSLTINSGGIYSATNETTTIAGAFDNSGTFTHNNGEVNLSANSVINGNGGTTDIVFYDLTTSGINLQIKDNITVINQFYADSSSYHLIYSPAILTLGNDSQSGVLTLEGQDKFNPYTGKIYGANESYLGIINGTNSFDWSDYDSTTHFKWLDIQNDVVTGSDHTVNITLDGNVSFQNLTLSNSDTLDLNGYTLNARDEVHLHSNATLVENGSVIAQLFNTTYGNNWTIGDGEVLNLSQVNISYSGYLRMNDGGTFHAPYGTANVYGYGGLGYSLYKESMGRFIHNDGKVENWCGTLGRYGYTDFTGENAFYDLAFSYTNADEELHDGCWNSIFGSIDVQHDITHQGFGSGYGIWQWTWGVGPYTLTLGNESYSSQATFQHMYGAPTTQMIIQAYNDSHPANLTFLSYNCMLDNVHCNLNAYAPNNVTISGLILNQEVNRAEDAAPKTLYVAGPVNFNQGIVLSSSALSFEAGVNATVEPGTTWSIGDSLIADEIDNQGTMNITSGGVVSFLDTSDAGFYGDGTLNVEGSEPFIGNDTGYMSEKYFDCGTGADLLSYENLTYSVWMKTTDTRWSYILYHYTTSDYEGVALGSHTNVSSGNKNDANFRVENDTGDAWTISDDTIDIIDGEWHHIAGVLNRSDNIIYLYVDGELKNQTDVTGLGTISEPTNLKIGHLYTSYKYTGYVDDVRIYDQPLSAGDILALNATTFSDTSNLVAHWTFDEVYNGTATDSIGDNDCTPLGASGIRTAITGGTTYNWTINNDELTINPFNWSTISHGNNLADNYIYTYNSRDLGNNTRFFFKTPQEETADCNFTQSGTLTATLECGDIYVEDGAHVSTGEQLVNVSSALTITNGTWNASQGGDNQFEDVNIMSAGTMHATNDTTTIEDPDGSTSATFMNYGTFIHNNGLVEFITYSRINDAGSTLPTVFYNLDNYATTTNYRNLTTINTLNNYDGNFYIRTNRADVHLIFGNATQAGTLNCDAGCTRTSIDNNDVTIMGASPDYPAQLIGNDDPVTGGNDNEIWNFKNIDVNMDFEILSGTGTTINLFDKVSFRDLYFYPDTNLNFGDADVTINGTIFKYDNVTITSNVANLTVTGGTVLLNFPLNLTKINITSPGSLLVTSGANITFTDTAENGFVGDGKLDVHGTDPNMDINFGGSLYLDDDNDLNGTKYVSLGADSSLMPTEQITMEAWVKHNETGSGQDPIIGNDADAYGNWFALGSSSTTPTLYSYMRGTTIMYGTYMLKSGEWHHISTTYNGSEKRIYLDGYLAVSVETSGSIDYTGVTDIRIGAEVDDNATLSIDEVRIWNTSRTQKEIISGMYQNCSQVTDSFGLVSCWGMNEGTGTTVSDYEERNHGILMRPVSESATSGWGSTLDYVPKVNRITIKSDSQWIVNTTAHTSSDWNWTRLQYGNNTGNTSIYAWNSEDWGNNINFVFEDSPIPGACTINGSLTLTADLNCSTIDIGDNGYLDTNNNTVTANSTVTVNGVYNATGDTVDSQHGQIQTNSGGIYAATSGITTLTGVDPDFIDNDGTFVHNDGTIVLDGVESFRGDNALTLYNVVVLDSASLERTDISAGTTVINEFNITDNAVRIYRGIITLGNASQSATVNVSGTSRGFTTLAYPHHFYIYAASEDHPVQVYGNTWTTNGRSDESVYAHFKWINFTDDVNFASDADSPEKIVLDGNCWFKSLSTGSHVNDSIDLNGQNATFEGTLTVNDGSLSADNSTSSSILTAYNVNLTDTVHNASNIDLILNNAGTTNFNWNWNSIDIQGDYSLESDHLNGIHFDGVDDYLRNSAIDIDNTSVTISLFWTPRETGKGAVLFGGTYGSPYNIAKTSSDYLTFKVRHLNGEYMIAGVTNWIDSTKVGKTYHLLGRWDKDIDGGNMSFFIDGEEVDYYVLYNRTCDDDLITNSLNAYIGNYDGSYTSDELYNIQVFNRSVSDAEITQLYNHESISEGRFVWLKFENSADLGQDFSGAGNDFTVYSTPVQQGLHNTSMNIASGYLNTTESNYSLQVGGNFTVESGATVDVQSSYLGLGSDFDITSGTLLYGTSTIGFDGSTNQTLYTTSPQEIHSLSVVNSGTETGVILNTGTLNATGTTRIVDGILFVNTGANHSLTDVVIYGAGTWSTTANTTVVSGDLNNSGTFTHNSGTLNLTGTGTVFGLAGTSETNYLIIDDGADITNNNSLDALYGPEVYGVLNSSTSTDNNTFELLNITSTGTYHATSGVTVLPNVVSSNNYAFVKSGTLLHNNGTFKMNASAELNLSSAWSDQLYSLELDNDDTANLESDFNLAGDLFVKTGSILNILSDQVDRDLTVAETFYLNGTYDGRTSNPSFGGFVIQDEGQYKLTNATLTLTGDNHELRNDGSSGAEPYPIILDDLSELCTVFNISEGSNINMSGAWDSQYPSGSQYGQEVIFVDGTLNIMPGAVINFSTLAEWYVGSNPGYCDHVTSDYDNFVGFQGSGDLNIEGTSGNEVIIQDFKGGTSHPDWADWYINASAMNISMNFADVSYGNNTADNVIFVRNGIDSGYNTPDNKWLFEAPADHCQINVTMTLGSNLECSKVIIYDGYELDANGYTITSTNYTLINGTLYGSTADQHLTFLKVNEPGTYNTTTATTHLTAGGVVDGALIFEGGAINGTLLINGTRNIWGDVLFNGGEFIPNQEIHSLAEHPVFYNLRIPYMSTFNANTSTVIVKHNFTNTGGFIGESAAELNGTEYVYFDALSAMESNVFSFDAWINPSGAGDRTVFSYHDYSGYQDGFMVQVQDNNTILLEVPQLTPATVESITVLQNETYAHIAVVHNSNDVQIYVNGELDTIKAVSGTVSVSDDVRSAIGANIQFSPINPTISEPFIGVIDEVRYWTTNLEEHEIRANMFKEVESSDANYALLIMYAKFNNHLAATFDLDKGGTAGTVKDYQGTSSGADDTTTTTGWVGIGNFSYDTSTMNFTEEGVISYVDNITFHNLAAGYTSSETVLFNSTTSADDIYVTNDFRTDIGIVQFEDMNVSVTIYAGTGTILGDNLEANGLVIDSGATFQNVINVTYTNESDVVESSTYDRVILFGNNNLSGDIVVLTEVHITDNQSLYTNFHDINTSKLLIGNYSELNVSETSSVRFSSTSGLVGSNGTLNLFGKAHQKLSGAYFDGADDYINVTEDDALDILTHNMSFSVWMNTNESGTVALLSKGLPRGSIEEGYELSLSHIPTQYAVMRVYDGTSLRSYFVDVGDDLNNSEWHNIIFTLATNETRTNISVYVDGVYKGNSDTDLLSSVDTADDLQIGMFRSDTDSYLAGILDDVRIFNRTLTATEVTSVYNLDSVTDGLVAQYEFENSHAWNGATNEVWDSAGNEHNGTTYGAESSQAIISATSLGENYWSFTADTLLTANFSRFEGYSSARINNYTLFGVWLNNVSGTAWSLDINETVNVSDDVDNFQRIRISDADIGLDINDNVTTLLDITIDDNMATYNIDTVNIEGGSIEFVNSSFNIASGNNFETDIISLSHNDVLNNYYIQVWSDHNLELSSLTNAYTLRDNVYVADNTFHSDLNATVHSLELEAANDVLFYIKDDSVLNILNGSFTYVDGDLAIEDGSQLNKNWYLDIYVNDSDGPAGYTNITINDTNGNLIFNGTTDIDGYVQTNITEYRLANAAKTITYYSNYSVRADSNYSIDLYIASSVNMSDNQIMYMLMQDYQAPQVAMVDPVNGSYKKASSGSILLKADVNDTVKIEYVNYTLVNSTNDDILNSSVDLSASIITDHALEVDWYNADWSDLDGNYTWNVTAYDNFGNSNENVTEFFVDNTDPAISTQGTSVLPISVAVNSNISINANVTEENVFAVWANITFPSGESEYVNLTQQEDLTIFNISYQTRALGTYDTLEIFAEDKAGNLDGPSPVSTFSTYMLAHVPETFDVSNVEVATFEIGDLVSTHVNVTDPLNATNIDVCLVNITNKENYLHVSEVNMTIDTFDLETGIYIYEYNLTAIPYNVTSIGDWQIDVFCNISNSYTTSNTTNITAVYTQYPAFDNVGANLADFGVDVATEIYANVTGIINETDSSVWANVSWPNGNLSEHNMTLVEYGDSSNLWNVSFNGSNEYDVIGGYNATIYVIDYNGNQNATNITFDVYQTTTVNLTLTPENLTVSTINASSGYDYNLTVILYNTGNATALSVAIDDLSSSVPDGWTFESVDGTVLCNSTRGDSEVRIDENCTKIYTVSIPANEFAGEHDFTFYASYNDLSGASPTPTSIAYTTILSNPILLLNETEVNETIHHNTDGEFGSILNLTSAGNYYLENITFQTQSGTLDSSWIDFSYSDDRIAIPFDEMTSNTVTTIYLNATIPAGYTAGNYTGTYLVNASNTTCLSEYDDRCYSSFDLTIEVPENTSWYSPSEVNTTVYDNTAGDLTSFNITNEGNVNMTWVITDLAGNASSLITLYNTSMTVGTEHAGTLNSTHTIHGTYDIALTQAPGIYEYVLQINNDSLSPGEINTTINVIVEDNIDPVIVSTSLSTTDNSNRTDFNKSMQIGASVTDNINISEVWAIVETPNGTNDTTYLTDSPTWTPTILAGEFNYTTNNGSLTVIENEYIDTSSPKIIWHLNESSGDNTEDSSDNDYLATVNGAVYVSGKYDNALSFDGTDDYVNSSDLQLTANNRTIAMWIKLDELDVDRSILSKNLDFEINQTSDRQWKVMILNDGTSVSTYNSHTTGTWHHVATVFNGTDIGLYIDGVYAVSTTYSSLPTPITAIELGRDVSSTVYFDGSIDEVLIFEEALSSDEVYQLSGDYTPEGNYTTVMYNASSKTFWSNVYWSADLPDGTNMTVQFQTSDNDTDWSDWSSEFSDSGSDLTSIGNATVIKAKINLYTNDTHYAPALDVFNITYGGGYVYQGNYTPLQDGIHNVTVYVNDSSNNIASEYTGYFETVANTTAAISAVLNDTTFEIDSYGNLNITTNNTGNATMYGADLRAYADSGITIIGNNTYACGNIAINNSCTANFTLYFTTSLINLATYDVYGDVNWTNADGTSALEIGTDDFQAIAPTDAWLHSNESSINSTVAHGYSSATANNFTLYVSGSESAIIETINFNVTEISNTSWIGFSSTGFDIDAGDERTIYIDLDIPLGTVPGEYVANITAYGLTGCSEAHPERCNISVPYNITVQQDDDNWNVTPLAVNIAEAATGTNSYYEVNITNDGNVDLDFSLSHKDHDFRCFDPYTGPEYECNYNPNLVREIGGLTISTATATKQNTSTFYLKYQTEYVGEHIFNLTVTNDNTSTEQLVPVNITSLGLPPTIENVTSDAEIYDINGTFNSDPFVNITTNITQDGAIGITNASINITYPSTVMSEFDFASPGGLDNEGIWIGNFTDLNTAGTYTITAWAINDNDATSTNTTTFLVVDTTTVDLDVDPTEKTLSGISQDSSETFEVNMTVNNTGNGTASTTINIDLPTGFSSSPSAISAFTLNRSQSDVKYVNITGAAATQSGYYYINFTNTWSNPDGTTNSTNQTLTVTVAEVRELDITESSLSIDLYPDESEQHNMTISSTGTATLLTIDPACEGDCSYFNYSFYPVQISSLDPGDSEAVTINITPKVDTLATTYTLNFTATAFGGTSDYLPTIIVVQEHKNWTVSPTSLLRNVGNDTSGIFGTVTISNTGDTVGIYNISLLNNTDVFFNVSEDYEEVTIQAGSSTTVPINYMANATGAFNAILSVNTDATLAQQNVSLRSTVVPLVVDIITPTQSNVTLVDPEDSVLIWVNISNGTLLTSGASWSIEIDSISTTVNSNSYDVATELWKINSSVPDLVPGAVQLEVTGTHLGVSVSDVELSSVNITDIAAPTITNATWPYTTPNNNITLSVDIEDTSEVNNVWLEVTQVNGSLENYTLSNESATNWTVNITNVTDVGDYDAVIFANDTWSNLGNATTWFEVRNETMYTFSGVIQDVKSVAWNTTFDFRKPGTEYSLYNLSTDLSTGAYSQQVHRRIYDIYITTNNNSVLLSNVSIYEDKSNTVTIYGYNTVDLTLNDVGYGPYSEIYFSSSLVTEEEELVMRYDEPIAAKNILGIYKCNSWDYDNTNPLCDNYNYTRYSNVTVNLTSWVISASVGNVTGPYLLSHFICGDQVCDEDYGESSFTCSRDCGGVVSDEQADLFDNVVSAAASAGGGGGGGGGADIDEIEELIGTSQQDIETDTDVLQVVLTPGETRVIKVGIKNNKFVDDNVELSIDSSSIFPFIDILDDDFEIAANDINYTDIKFSAGITTMIGTYTGNLIIESEDSSIREVPVVLMVVDPDMPLLDVVVTPLTKRVAPGGQLVYKVEILNMGETQRVDIVNNHIIREIETGAVILKISETIAVDERLTYTKTFDISESTREGQYQIELVAKYADGERTAMALETFEVTSEPLVFSAVKRLSKSWITYVLIVLFVLLVYYGPILYNIWKARRKQQQRYVFPLDKKFLPAKEANSVSVGRIAETQDNAYINLLDLKVHMLCAGATGGGKSVSAQIVVEEALKKGVAVIVFDPTFQWSGFINKSTDSNMTKLYDKFGMKQEEASAFNTKLYQVEDPDMKIDITKHIVPGQITVFGMNKLTASKLDVFVKNTIKAVFDANLPTTSKLKLLLVYDEIHRVLPKYGGSKAYLYLEKGVREFRKWGVGMVMISQVISDFKEAIATNIGTEIQMRTKYKGDLKRVEDKYGKEYAVALPRLKVGTGMVQNSEYNKGRPYFVEFRPLLHSTDKVTDSQYAEMKKLEGVLFQIGTKLIAFKKAGKKIDDVKVEFDLARDKLKSGNTRMVKSYIESIISKLKKMQ
jgi:hypothetical protein